MIDLSAREAVEAIVGIIVLYANYRTIKLRVEVRSDTEKIVKENCAARADFVAHVQADEKFQNELKADIALKRLDYQKQHEDHYRHEKEPSIHQVTMSEATLKATFLDFLNQLKALGERVEYLAEQKRARQR